MLVAIVSNVQALFFITNAIQMNKKWIGLVMINKLSLTNATIKYYDSFHKSKY